MIVKLIFLALMTLKITKVREDDKSKEYNISFDTKYKFVSFLYVVLWLLVIFGYM